MPSSISHSKIRWPRRTLAWLAIGLTAWAAAAAYTMWGNPEIRHFRMTHAIKRAWAERMTREHGGKTVVFGGSSCEFSIDGERMLRVWGMPCVNLGRGAGMGSVVLTMAALEETRPGDTLIMAMEPALVTEPPGFPALGIQFSVATGHSDWLRRPLAPVKPLSWTGVALAMRPGGFHTVTMAAKLLSGGELYRYRIEAMRPSGFNQTPVRLPLTGPPGHGVSVPESARAWLRSLAAWCRTHDVRLAYSLPWAYAPAEAAAAFRRDNAAFLMQVMEIMPVLRDATLGALTDAERFADTAWHLDEAGAAERTDVLAEAIAEWRLWSREELAALLPDISARTE